MDRVSEMVADEIKLLQKNLISKDELEKSKEQLKGNYILALEGTGSRMNGAGKSELLLGHIKTPDEVLNKLDSIDMSQIQEVVERVFQFDRFSFAAVGRVNQDFKINKFFE